MNNVGELVEEFLKIFEKRMGRDKPGDVAMAIGMVLHLLVKGMVANDGSDDQQKKESEIIELISLLIRGKHPVLEQMKKGNKK